VKTVELWDLDEYNAKAHCIKSVVDMDKLKRYDCSLHQGWYCCRFIVMRMVVDKFGTGASLLVYSDSVIKSTDVSKEQEAKTSKAHKGQTKLGGRDFDSVIASSVMKDKLLIVKLGAIWCPPCRLMDSVIDIILKENKLDADKNVFFEVDIDEEKKLARRWNNEGIPFVLFYHNGKHIPVQCTTQTWAGRIIDGGLVGGMKQKELLSVIERVWAAVQASQATADLL